MKIIEIKKIKPQMVYAIQTSTHTFIADGLAHHNCVRCNIYLSGNVLNYMDSIIKLYGKGIIKKLRDNDKKTLTFTVEYLDKKRKMFINKTKKLLDNFNKE